MIPKILTENAIGITILGLTLSTIMPTKGLKGKAKTTDPIMSLA